MKKAVIILAHGSKNKEIKNTLNSIIEKLKNRTQNPNIFGAFMQFSEDTLERAVEKATALNINDITVMPLFLFDGVHTKADIPNKIAEIRKKHNVNINLLNCIGDDDILVELILKRI